MTPEHRGKALSWAKRENILEVNLHQPPCNEIGTQMLADLKALTVQLEQTPSDIRVLLLYSGLESGFCAGADLRELHAELVHRNQRGIAKQQSAQELRDFLDSIHDVFNALDRLPLVTIAAVHGPVFGGGLELALVCDLIVADATARFCFPELRLGLVPGFGGIPRLKRDVGNSIIRDLLFTGRSLNARRAHEVGLVSQRVSHGEALSAARALAKQVSQFDRSTVAVAKPFAKPTLSVELEKEKDLFCELFLSPRVEEALAHFLTRTDLRAYLP